MKLANLLLLCTVFFMMPLLGYSQYGVTDPQGTVIVNLRNTSNGNTLLNLESGTIWVSTDNNLTIDGNLKLYYAGTVEGIGSIPLVEYGGNGWVNKTALEPGYGYLLYDTKSRTYGRIYVVKWLISAADSKSIVGVQIKYQFPWHTSELTQTKRVIRIQREKQTVEKEVVDNIIDDNKRRIEEEEKMRIYTQKEYIVINGLKWDTKNTLIGNMQHFTFGEANQATRSTRKRLPTNEEFEALKILGVTWDENLNGYWFGEDHQLKSSSERSVFFPASGSYDNHDGSHYGAGSYGGYWSGSPTNDDSSYCLNFYGRTAYPKIKNLPPDYRLSVRCVQY